jgi:hypothetical protein
MRYGCVLATLVFTAASAGTDVLYDAQLASLPEVQGWSYFTLPTVADAVESAAAKLDTTSSDLVRGGWTRVGNPAMTLAEGIQLDFRLRIAAESHNTTNRAGFSVIVLDHSKRGIELGFWKDHVWAQSDVPLFTHAEDAALDTSTAPVDYTLVLSGDAYTLAGGGKPLLSGKVRDYTAFVGSFDVYETPDFLFFGDDTTSGSARVLLQSVRFTRGAVIGSGRPPALSVYTSGPVVSLRWPAASGVAEWILESTADPVNGPWAVDPAPRGFEPGEGTGSVQAQPDTTAGQRYYRLR